MVIGTRFSPCKRYRYTLERDLSMLGTGVLLFVMLNPSTADAATDDPTIRRCIDFGRRWDFATLLVGNLYAWRSTDPLELWSAKDPVGPHNRIELISLLQAADRVVCAWGQRGPNHHWYDATVALIHQMRAARAKEPPGFLRMNGNGCPGHPLYIPAATKPTAWLA